MHMLKVFSDYHHSSLYYSLHLLFEKRLDGVLYRPIGMDWWTNKFWAINNSEATAKQFLEVNSIPPDGTMPLNNSSIVPNNVYSIEDNHDHFKQKAIEFEAFMETDFDIVIASVPQHIKPLQKLASLKNAKFIFQMGNRFTEVLNNMHEIPNLLASIKPFSVPKTCNACFYRQEFSLETFKPTTNKPKKQITSFINVYHENKGFQNYMGLKGYLPDWEFKSYGGQCEDGSLTGIDTIASIMQSSAWGFHVKAGADGYGHILTNWFAVGRPVIINYEEYQQELGGELLIPGETCLVAQVGQDMREIAQTIQEMPQHQYEWMCSRVREVFSRVVDFDRDEANIRAWLTQLH